MFCDKSNPNLPRHALWRPGKDWDAIGALDPTSNIRPPRVPRIRMLVSPTWMGIDQPLLYPTWFAEGFFLVRDPDIAYALARAYNDWIADFCKAAPEQLFAAAILPLQNMDFTLEELQWVARVRPVRAVFMRPMFLEERYFNHPYYDPLWAELELARGHSSCARDPGPVEPGMDLARSVFRKDQGPARPADRAGRG